MFPVKVCFYWNYWDFFVCNCSKTLTFNNPAKMYRNVFTVAILLFNEKIKTVKLHICAIYLNENCFNNKKIYLFEAFSHFCRKIWKLCFYYFHLNVLILYKSINFTPHLKLFFIISYFRWVFNEKLKQTWTILEGR